jgi:hypothetical protein
MTICLRSYQNFDFFRKKGFVIVTIPRCSSILNQNIPGIRHSGRSVMETRNQGIREYMMDSRFRGYDGKNLNIEYKLNIRCFAMVQVFNFIPQAFNPCIFNVYAILLHFIFYSAKLDWRQIKRLSNIGFKVR